MKNEAFSFLGNEKDMKITIREKCLVNISNVCLQSVFFFKKCVAVVSVKKLEPVLIFSIFTM